MNAFSVSLLVLIPQVSPGWSALAAGLVAGYATLRLSWLLLGFDASPAR